MNKITLLLSTFFFLSAPLQGQTDNLRVEDRTVGDDPQKHYFLFVPPATKSSPDTRHGLVLILPGGPGNADFLPFCKQMAIHGIPSGFIVAQLVAPKWSDQQQIIWPTSKLPEKGMRFTTEELIENVIDDISKRSKIDSRYIFTISWSSGGPAAYVASLTSKRVKGSLIAMSVFRPEWLPPLDNAKGHSYYLYHSPDDQICPYVMAEAAKKLLSERGANVELKSYKGGHGWVPFTHYFDSIKEGIEWLKSKQIRQK